jgi:addiction module HigA family antidote
MDRPNEDYSAEYEELSIPQYHLLLSQLNDRERFAFLVCGPWHLSEYDASMFLGSKLAKRVVKERRKWPTGIPIVEASRVFNIKVGTLSSQISRAMAKLRSKLSNLKAVRPTRSARPSDSKLQVLPVESAVEPVAGHSPTNPASQAFARMVVGEPSNLVPGWAGTPPSRSADLPSREFSQIDQREELRKISKPCGSYFKGCMNCGDLKYAGKCKKCGVEIRTTQQMETAECESTICNERQSIVKLRKYYTSGYSVRKAYSPQAAGFTYWCYMCGARDENCWEGFVGERDRGNPVPAGNARKCGRILQLLKAAEKPEDMKIAGLHFHALKESPKRWSVCATGNDRITFGWLGKNVKDVDFEDYYQGRTEVMERKNGRPVHPGAIIKQDILPSVGLSVTAAAKALRVAPKTLQNILTKRKPLSTIMCLKVSRLFGKSPEFWMRLQAAYDLKKAQQDKKLMERVARIVPLKEPVEEVQA